MSFTNEQYEQMAIQAIIDYKNKDYTEDEIKTLYPLAISIVIENIKKSLKVDRNISSETVGDESRTFKDGYSVVDDSVKFIVGKRCLRYF
ncbi:hypothetical protein [Clostridium beijerinckii]|uniref:hypothetical protein n=1 Tax=Clostridium beijerinckii TaxID=1520 RepID=UPI00098C1D16|nr:hypothetical protein [Clostridium beijerinckii]NRT78122.1 hypothetical protein [Clostridium beijerinckii]OOM44798.1 hypothetical protein CBEIJ_35440 [Clostridium beijerinckii]